MSQSAQIFLSMSAAGLAGIAADVEAMTGIAPEADGTEDFGFMVEGLVGSLVLNHLPDEDLKPFGAEIIIDSPGETDLLTCARKLYEHLRETDKYQLRLVRDSAETLEESSPTSESAAA